MSGDKLAALRMALEYRSASASYTEDVCGVLDELLRLRRVLREEYEADVKFSALLADKTEHPETIEKLGAVPWRAARNARYAEAERIAREDA